MNQWYTYYKDLYEACASNKEFLEVIQKYEKNIKNLDESIFPKNKNKDIIVSQENLEDIFFQNMHRILFLDRAYSS